MQLAVSGQLLARVEPLECTLALLRFLEIGAIEIWPANVPDAPGVPAGDAGTYERKDLDRARRLLDEHDVSVDCVTRSGRPLAQCIDRRPEHGGGPLPDVGVYSVFTLRHVTGRHFRAALQSGRRVEVEAALAAGRASDAGEARS